MAGKINSHSVYSSVATHGLPITTLRTYYMASQVFGFLIYTRMISFLLSGKQIQTRVSFFFHTGHLGHQTVDCILPLFRKL